MSDSKWVSMVENCPAGLSDADKILWRASLIERLRTGMMPAKATRWTRRWIVDPYGKETEFTMWGNPHECWDGKLAIAMSQPSQIKEDEELDLDFWIDELCQVNASWTKIDYGSFGYANWLSGDFASSSAWSDPFGDAEESRYIIWAIDVRVNSDLIARFNNNFVKQVDNKPVDRISKHDWIASLNHLIAISEIDSLVSDPHAHGAQACVERAMADWFAINASQIPSEAMIRSYAAKVIKAMKAYQTKG